MQTQLTISLTTEDLSALVKKSVLEVLEDKQLVRSQASNAVYSVSEAADFLGIKTATLYEKTSQKLIGHAKQGKKIYFRQADLDAYLSEGRVSTKQELRAKAEAHMNQNLRRK